MNGRDRIRAALAGERPDVTPVMLHNFLMAARESGVPMSRYRRDPRAIARCHIEAVERYGYDGVVVDVDTATLAGAMGAQVAFPDDEPAVCRGSRLRSLDDVRELEPVDISKYEGVQVWLEAARLLVRHFGGEVYVRGNCDQCPFSLAGALRGSEDWLAEVASPDRHEAAHSLLEYCLGATVQFIRLMAETGVDMVSNGDSPAGPSVVSPRIYRSLALPYEKRVAEAARALGLPWLLHICGKTELILADMAATGAGALELDFKTDPRRARESLGGKAAFVGNIDPTGVLAAGTPATVEAAVRELLGVFEGESRFILNAGCAIPETTPPENLRALIRATRG